MNPRRKSRFKLVILLCSALLLQVDWCCMRYVKISTCFIRHLKWFKARIITRIKNLKWGSVFVLAVWWLKDGSARSKKLKSALRFKWYWPSDHCWILRHFARSFPWRTRYCAQGVLTQPTVLTATEVLAKHDENYVPPELGEKMQKCINQWGQN